eukprot:scaffold3639_cov141-Isochrysis_galbana.AAC.9
MSLPTLLILAPKREREPISPFARHHLVHLRPRLEDDDSAAERLDVDGGAATAGRVRVEAELPAPLARVPVGIEVD